MYIVLIINTIKNMKLDTINHFVHLWFDYQEQRDFTKLIKNRINEISKKTNNIINFIDEVIPTKKEAELIHIQKLSYTLSYFINFNYTLSFNSPFFREDLIYKSHEHPKEIFDFLFNELDWKIESLRSTKNKQETDFFKEIFIKENFHIILEKLINTFKFQQNIYSIKYNNDFEIKSPFYNDRREEILNFALNKLWENRIIISWMNNWDTSSIKFIKEYSEEEKESLMMRYWQAYDYLFSIWKIITNSRYKRLRKHFFESLEKNNLKISNGTKHILWWEYQNRCVRAYWELLNIYWIDEKLINEDNSISLISPRDK